MLTRAADARARRRALSRASPPQPELQLRLGAAVKAPTGQGARTELSHSQPRPRVVARAPAQEASCRNPPTYKYLPSHAGVVLPPSPPPPPWPWLCATPAAAGPRPRADLAAFWAAFQPAWRRRSARHSSSAAAALAPPGAARPWRSAPCAAPPLRQEHSPQRRLYRAPSRPVAGHRP